MGTTKSRQGPTRFDQLKCPKMDLLISPQRVRNGGAVSCERWRIEHNQVPPRDNFFVRFAVGLSFKPIKDIAYFERTLLFESIGDCIAPGCCDSLRTLVDHV